MVETIGTGPKDRKRRPEKENNLNKYTFRCTTEAGEEVYNTITARDSEEAWRKAHTYLDEYISRNLETVTKEEEA